MVKKVEMNEYGMDIFLTDSTIQLDWVGIIKIKEAIFQSEIKSEIDYIIEDYELEEYVNDDDYDDWIDSMYPKVECWWQYHRETLLDVIYETMRERGVEF